MDEIGVKHRIVGIPWVKGQSGNPRGRPKRLNSVTTLLAELLKDDPDRVRARWTKAGKWTGAMNVANALYLKMKAGDVNALKLGTDRTEGRVKETVDVQVDNKQTVIQVVSENTKSLTERVMAGERTESMNN